MKLIFGKSKWEMWEAPLRDYIVRVARDGFSAAEIYLDGLPARARSPRMKQKPGSA